MNEDLILGAILADGTSRRMQRNDSTNTDKCFSILAGKPLIEHVIARATSQVNSLVINSSSQESLLTFYHLPIVPDFFVGATSTSDITPDNHLGPLAGIASLLRWAQIENISHGKNHQWLATFPCDTPFFPATLVSQLLKEAKNNNALAACATYKEKISPLCSIWSLSLLSDLIIFLEEGNRKAMHFLEVIDHVTVEFEELSLNNIDPFYNINTPEQLKEAQQIYSQIKE